jgi:hypothetical protein
VCTPSRPFTQVVPTRWACNRAGPCYRDSELHLSKPLTCTVWRFAWKLPSFAGRA